MSSSTSSSVPQPPDGDRARTLRLAKLFDLRTFIGTLFVIFGITVTIEGLTATDADIAKAAGINISLWTGLPMLLLGVLFIVWMLLAPPDIDVKTDDLSEEPRRGGH